MKILIVNYSDLSGGAARASYRLFSSLNKLGIDSEMLVAKKISDSPLVKTFPIKINYFRLLIVNYFNLQKIKKYRKRDQVIFSPSLISSKTAVKLINKSDADIVHLHWINNGMLSISDIKKIKKPVVWSLHDMWAFTGGCHYDQFCGKYEDNCHNCPILKSNKNKDLAYKVHLKKTKIYQKHNNITVVGLSKWLADSARKSSIFRGFNIVQLPNPIDTSIFSPVDKVEARKILNLPIEEKIILFGAMSATSDERKGYKQLINAIMNLDMNGKKLVVFGSSRPIAPDSLTETAIYLGRVNDDINLKLIYSAADVMVVPSIQENLSNAIMESLSCGTPVVAFNIGGNSDMIIHKRTGYLATPYDSYDLSAGISWVLNNNRINLSINSRKVVMDNFNDSLIGKKYKNLYEHILDSNVTEKDNFRI